MLARISHQRSYGTSFCSGNRPLFRAKLRVSKSQLTPGTNGLSDDRSPDRGAAALRRVLFGWPRSRAHSALDPGDIAQRVYGLALGYEDLNDHEHLRHDPLLGLLAGKRDLDAPLAGKSTLNRLELSRPEGSRYHKIGHSPEKIDRLLVDLFLESHARAPRRIVLDLDATDIPLHGHQESRFFHGYYDSYCYLPLYIFAGDQLLCARLRPADQDGAAGAVDEVAHRRPDSPALAASPDAGARRLRLLPRGTDGMVRTESRRLRARHGAQ